MRKLPILLTAFVACRVQLAAAQCPNGTPPPCPGARAPDPHLLAILPFRTTGAAPALAYLGDGMVELLSAQFTGEGGWLAADAGTVLRAWTRLPEPAQRAVDQASALRVARSVGAARALIGGVVGSERSLTMTASVVSLDGSTDRAPITVTGPSDSLAVLVGELSARLLSRGTGGWRLTANDPGTMSPAALRAYVAGRAAYRESRFRAAVDRFTEALTFDSTFALAAYWRAFAAILPGRPGAEAAAQRAWSMRERLGERERTILISVLGPAYPARSEVAVLQEAREAAVARFPGWEAWFFLGDLYFHAGGMLEVPDWAGRARTALEHSMSIDTTAGVVDHLLFLYLGEGDTAAARRLLATRPGDANLGYRFALAALAGSPEELRSIRSRAQSVSVPSYLQQLGVPQTETDTALAWSEARIRDDAVSRAGDFTNARVLANAGRPTVALAMLTRRHERAEALLAALQAGVDDSTTVSQLEALLPAQPPVDSVGAAQWRAARCEVALAHLRARSPVDSAFFSHVSTDADRRCAQVIRAVAASRRGVMDELLAVDSAARRVPPDLANWWNYDIALAFAERGRYGQAAAAARRWPRIGSAQLGGTALYRLGRELCDGGRWSLAAGDSTSARRALRHCLALLSNPEPALVAERDSVRAILARLERRP